MSEEIKKPSMIEEMARAMGPRARAKAKAIVEKVEEPVAAPTPEAPIMEEPVVEAPVAEAEEKIEELSKDTLKDYKFKQTKLSAKNDGKVKQRQKGYGLATQKILGKGVKVPASDARREEVEATAPAIAENEALDSLHPNSRPENDPKSKLEAMRAVIGSLANMDTTSLVKLFNDITPTIKSAEKGGNGSAEANRASVAMKGAVKEDVEALFADQELSEEFKDKTLTLFEAAVAARLIEEKVKLDEAYQEIIEQTLEEAIESLTAIYEEKIDGYFEYVAEKWLSENQVAIESTLRNELAEEFITGLRALFIEHNIAIPEEKVDVLESMTEELDAVKAKLNEVLNENIELRGHLTEIAKFEMVEELSEGLTLVQAEKFKALAEGVDADDLETFESKLKLVRESYFSTAASTKKPVPQSNVLTETFEGETEPQKAISPEMASFANAIKRTVR